MMEIYNRRHPTAKKNHRCEMCGQNIEVGEKYVNESGKWDGDFFERKMHSECFEMFEMMLSEMGETEFSWDDFSDWWMDNRCYVCKYRHSICEPDEYCTSSPSDCIYKVEGRCIASDDCTDMTHIGWCKKFEQEQSGLTGGEPGYEISTNLPEM